MTWRGRVGSNILEDVDHMAQVISQNREAEFWDSSGEPTTFSPENPQDTH